MCIRDSIYTEVKDIFLKEMSGLPDLPTSNNSKSNNKFRKSKPFWNDDLSQLWKNVCTKEKIFLGFRCDLPQQRAHKTLLRQDYNNSRKMFDKKFRYFKRKYKAKQMSELHNFAEFNPNEMWKQLKKLGNDKPPKAILEVIRADESISSDTKEILKQWYTDISKLYSGVREDPDIVFDNDFFDEILQKKERF